ncbi:prolyl oligopeptidase family serine peptidase [Sphingomonas solaris]|uniref:prolyl oligopeptidase n=1 Tax=Alterirhizorhabdus solaris TaxID=2529389 RepID=A0A558QRA5_9SPHN|nr:prolyl oligopeptidase family serine peptidase [Sphingomonas solaris]TVV69663.1 S9 family peptidase [Sphingomonas solaris]
MPSSPTPPYPQTPRGTVRETLFGETIADPYRWLENDVRTDPQVRDWVTVQSKLAADYLSTLPGRAAIERRMKTLWDYERFGLPERAGKRIFYQRNTGLQNQSPLYVQEGAAGTPRLLIDPNAWAKDGATALAEWKASDDGKRLVYAVQDGGTDWRTLKVLDVATGAVQSDDVQWAKFTGLAWAKDGAGFFYSRFPAPEGGATFQSLNLNQAVWYHAIGTPQSADRQMFATPDRPKLNHVAEVTEDGRWLLVRSSEGTDARFELTLIDLAAPKAAPRTLVRGLENSWALVGSVGQTFYFLTDLAAPRQRIVAIDVEAATPTPREIVPEGEAKLEEATIAGDRLVLSYLRDAKSEVRLATLDGRAAGTVALPGIGTVMLGEGTHADPTLFYSYGSYAVPTSIHTLDAATGRDSVFRAPKVAFDPAAFTVEQRFYASKDGTRVPMFVIRRKDATGPAPTILYGYGGFDISLTPGFSPAVLQWVEMGGTYVVANLRGGGEYGNAWHDGGRLANKQNVFDDCIAAAEYLVAQGIASKDGLALSGRSNGGLLVGAVVNQRPDLFAAAIPGVGVMDMLRFDRFTAGRYWVDDYGDPSKEADFRVLRAYSPYHNIRAGKAYPAIMVATADTDDRVVPGHSFKYAAALQAADIGDKPHLIRIETRAGHGSGKPTDKVIEEYADLWAFVAKWTGLKVPE